MTGLSSTGCDSSSAVTDTDTVDQDTLTTSEDTVAEADTATTDEDSTTSQDDTATLQETADTAAADAVEDAADIAEDTTELGDAADTTAVSEDDTEQADTSVPLFAPLEITVPEGFFVDIEGHGFTIYRKDYAGGEPDWVTVVDLRIADLRSVVGETFPPPTASVEQRATIQHWDDAVSEAASEGKRARILFSGAYFSPDPDPAPLAHGLQIASDVISYGYGHNEYPGYVNTVCWNNETDEAAILPYNVLSYEAYPEVVGGLELDVPREDAQTPKARIFIGMAEVPVSGDSDTADVLFFLTSKLQTQGDAAQVLSEFGATATSTWTGGGTTIFAVDGVEWISPGRKEPHTVAIYEPLDYGCASPCPAHSACVPETHQCVCDAGYSGASCETCDVCAPTEVIVDDTDDGFTMFGAEYWWTKSDAEGYETRAYGGSLHFTFGDEAGEQVYTGRWRTPTPLTGTYKIEAHIPAPDDFDPYPSWSGIDHWTVCDAVRYIVLDDDAPTGALVTRDHHITGWVTLKDAATFTDRRGDVRSDDHAAQYCAIPFDAIRWTRVTQ